MNRINSSALWQASYALFIMSDTQIIKSYYEFSNYKFFIYRPFQVQLEGFESELHEYVDDVDEGFFKFKFTFSKQK